MKNNKNLLFNNLNDRLAKVLLLNDLDECYKGHNKQRLSQEWLDTLWDLGNSGYYFETNNDLRRDLLVKLGLVDYFTPQFDFNYAYPTRLGIEYLEYALPQFIKYKESVNDTFQYNRNRVYKTQQRKHEYNVDANLILFLVPIIIGTSLGLIFNISTGLITMNIVLGLTDVITMISIGLLAGHMRQIYPKANFLRLSPLTSKIIPTVNFMRIFKYQDNRISKASYLQFMIKHVNQINKQQGHIKDLGDIIDNLFMQNYGYHINMPRPTDLPSDSDGALVDSMGNLTSRGRELEG